MIIRKYKFKKNCEKNGLQYKEQIYVNHQSLIFMKLQKKSGESQQQSNFAPQKVS